MGAVPFRHVKTPMLHADCAESGKLPVRHGVHLLEPACAISSSLQLLQSAMSVARVDALKVPAGHGEHTTMPSNCEKYPALQSLQAVMLLLPPCTLPSVPLGQK